MEILDALEIQGRPGSRVELWRGDLTALESADAVDALILSAFPNDYTPTPGSLIGALDQYGLSVAELARDKDLDIRPTHSCWLSRPFERPSSGLRYKRIVCFEPAWASDPPERVGEIFRALEWILAVRPEIRSAAMPVVAAGDMGYQIDVVLPRILEAALPWLEIGLGLNRLAITTRSEGNARAAEKIFADAKRNYTSPAAPLTESTDFDVFVSYSHQNSEIADAFVALLRARRPAIRIFLDREHLQTGMAWQEEIYESLEKSRYVAALLSPAYLDSTMCKEEFGIARLHGSRVDRPFLQPLYVLSADLPTRIEYLQYMDAREDDRKKLERAADEIVSLLAN